ncbi:MAG: AAA family ATPase [Patescibacteria group bacterium]
MLLRIKNYRAFSGDDGFELNLSDGFVISLLGPNNAGKSSVLRLLYDLKDLFSRLVRLHGFGIGNPRFEFNYVYSHPTEIVPRTSADGDFEITLKDNISNRIVSIVLVVSGTSVESINLLVDGERFSNLGYQINNDVLVSTRGEENISLISFRKVFNALSDTFYVPAFRNAINLGSNENYMGLKTGTSFIRLVDEQISSDNATTRIEAEKITSDIRRILDMPDFRIWTSQNGKLMVQTSTGTSRLEDLGSGVSQLVIVLLNLAVAKPSIILIDEPELGLHPALQIAFINTLLSYSKYGVAFATHSIGLARATSDHVYWIEQTREGKSTLSSFETDGRVSYEEFLGEVGFESIAKLDYETLLLVEGKNDIKVFHQLLRNYSKLDRVLILPLGGGNLIRGGVELEMSHFARIAASSKLAWIDSDRTVPDEDLDQHIVDFVDLCAIPPISIDVSVSDRRELENYFPHEYILNVIPGYQDIGSFGEATRDLKRLGWQVAKRINPSDLEGTDLGVFLNGL